MKVLVAVGIAAALVTPPAVDNYGPPPVPMVTYTSSPTASPTPVVVEILSATGSDTGPALVAVGVLVLVGAGGVVLASRRRRE